MLKLNRFCYQALNHKNGTHMKFRMNTKINLTSFPLWGHAEIMLEKPRNIQKKNMKMWRLMPRKRSSTWKISIKLKASLAKSCLKIDWMIRISRTGGVSLFEGNKGAVQTKSFGKELKRIELNLVLKSIFIFGG